MPELATHAIKVSLLTPAGPLFTGPARYVRARSPEGRLGVLAGHTPLVALLVPDVLVIEAETETRYYAVTGGVLEVRPGSEVVVLADVADRRPTAEAAEERLAELRAASSTPDKAASTPAPLAFGI
jgi:F-type H+-transporting ATPase subunit epsilon